MTEAWNQSGHEVPLGGSVNTPRVLLLDGFQPALETSKEFAARGWCVYRSSNPLSTTTGFDLIVSHGFRHRISEDVITESKVPMLNLHIGYLPFNKGAQPGFWCFYDGTPVGVAVHEMTAEIDGGPLVARRLVDVDPWCTTFREAYDLLQNEVVSLFWEVFDDYSMGRRTAKQQVGRGTQHYSAQLPSEFSGWDVTIGPEIDRLHEMQHRKRDRGLELISEIERVRTANNVNWMNILRLAFRDAPDEAQEILRRINTDDQSISSLLGQLAKL